MINISEHNFVAFRFTDNDFHHSLEAAIKFVAQRAADDMSEESWLEFVVICTDAMHRLAHISDWGSGHRARESTADYIRRRLTVSKIKTLSDLNVETFEGYVLDTHTGVVFYVEY